MYEAPAAASTQVKIESVNFVLDEYVVVGSMVKLTVRSVDGSGHIIPPNTVYTWTVTPLFGKPLPCSSHFL